MGHDIWAYRSEKEHNEWADMPLETRDGEWEKHKAKYVIATLRRGAFNDLAREIYIALQCPEFDSGVSGCGEGKHFTRAELQEAVMRLKLSPAALRDELNPEFNFLWGCINNGPETGVWIDFA